MVKESIIFILILFISNAVFSQKDTTEYTYYQTGELKSKTTVKYTHGEYRQWNSYFKTKWFYKNGQISHLTVLRNAEKDSLEVFWYENGQKREQYYWKNGKKEGMSFRWYETGELSSSYNHSNNKPHGTCYTFYKDGNINSIENFYFGIRHGRYTVYYEDGSCKANANFVYGKGVLKYFTKDKTIIEIYDNDILQKVIEP